MPTGWTAQWTVGGFRRLGLCFIHFRVPSLAQRPRPSFLAQRLSRACDHTFGDAHTLRTTAHYTQRTVQDWQEVALSSVPHSQCGWLRLRPSNTEITRHTQNDMQMGSCLVDLEKQGCSFFQGDVKGRSCEEGRELPLLSGLGVYGQTEPPSTFIFLFGSCPFYRRTSCTLA